MKKTFNTIGMSDKIYSIKKNGYIVEKRVKTDGYDADADIMKTHDIENIKVDLENGTIDFNRISGHHSGMSYLCRIPIDRKNDFVHETKDHIFLLNHEDFSKHIKDVVLNEIRKTEKSIIDFKDQKTEYIKELRTNYWGYLQS